jgi:hypothetical protein
MTVCCEDANDLTKEKKSIKKMTELSVDSYHFETKRYLTKARQSLISF